MPRSFLIRKSLPIGVDVNNSVDDDIENRRRYVKKMSPDQWTIPPLMPLVRETRAFLTCFPFFNTPLTDYRRNSLVSSSVDETKFERQTAHQTISPAPSSDSSTSSTSASKTVTVAYTYDAFFVSDGRSRRNKKTVTEKTTNKYSCDECGKHYATSSNLSRHKQTHRALDSTSAKTCPHCSKAYVSMPALAMHVLTHELRHSCRICGKRFSRPWLLQGHMRSHTGERPYGCAHCGKAFADRSNLRAHMHTHSSSPKQWQCSKCQRHFALKSYLNKHLECGQCDC